jgi:hypothetical protein
MVDLAGIIVVQALRQYLLLDSINTPSVCVIGR